MRENIYDALSCSLTDHGQGLQTKRTLHVKINMIVKCEAQEIIVFRVDRKLGISALKVVFVNATTPSFSQNELAQTVDTR